MNKNRQVDTITIACAADIVAARQQGRDLALELGFSSTESTFVATAISELSRNIVRYANRGELRVQPVTNGSMRGIKIVAADSGPGIPDIRRAMMGGYSTSGGLGLGLSGVRRLMDDMDVQSEPGEGTIVTATKWQR